MMHFNQGAQGFQSILTTVLVGGSRDAATLIFLLISMFILDPLLTVLSFTVAPAVFLGINMLIKRIKDVMQLELAGLTELNKHVRETVQGITVIKSFNLEKALKNQTEDVVDGLRERKDKIATLQAAPVPLLDTLGGVAIGFAILYAGTRTVTGEYNSENFIAFALALVIAAEHARRLSQLPVKLKTAMVMVNLVFTLLNIDEKEQSGPNSLEIKTTLEPHDLNGTGAAVPLIQFKDISFSYDGKTPVLKNFNLNVDPGEMVALVGPSGAGKSTIFKLLLKLHEPTQGNIIINGYNQNDLELSSLRDQISFVSQSNFIFSGTIKDNLTFKDDNISQDVIQHACEAVGLHHFISNLPSGYYTDVGELGSLISGGQAQRMNMARAIIKDSPILLLDEVTSALDAENEQLIKNYVKNQKGRKTILVIAHRLSTIKDASQIALINEGSVMDKAPHEQLMESNEYYEKIVSLQYSQ